MRNIKTFNDRTDDADVPPALRFEVTSQMDSILSEKTKKPEFMNVIHVYIRAPGDTKTEVVDIAEMTAYDAFEKDVDVERMISKYVEDPETGKVEERKEKMSFREKRVFHTPKTVYPWLDKVKERAHHGQIGQRYLNHCLEAFNNFKKNESLPTSGYALVNWRGIDPAMRDRLLGMGINTVELVSTMTEEAMQYLGMGARAIKQKAEAFLLQNNAPEQAAIEMTQLKQSNETLMEQISAMQAKMSEIMERQNDKNTQDMLRAQYTAVSGNLPDMRWGVKKLAEEIEKAEKEAA
jgi:hypothetical protein